MTKGYTNLTDVSLYLGKTSGGITTLSTDQQTQVNELLSEVETYIDRETRRAWFPAGTQITAERYDLILPVLYLRYRPVTSVQLIQTRSRQIGDTLYTCTQGSPGVPGDYELIDANMGEVRFMDGFGAADPQAPRLTTLAGAHSLAFVTYTPNRPVPPDISRCACMIVAHSMYLPLNADRWGLDEVYLDQSTKMTYTALGTALAIPAEAERIIQNYTRSIIG